MNSTEKTQYTLLHVEDSPEIQELVRYILTSRPSIKVISAETVAEGVQQAKKHQPDLVLMDVHLPDGSGLDALKQMQAFKETANIPVVALSSLATQLQIEEGLKEGFKYYITKPIDVPEFLETVDRILDSAVKR
ncbi:MAG: response regulator [Nitrospinae bacterium]|nr:response regulator [Nitrospinota bacterium]MCH7650494.1 response regulator [Nitrospinota bacterium]TDJ50834.1 MAG: response regulator [Nitrospina sp.]TDJ62268.1 MAG: response regulator [Nitrospina sp.]